MFQTRRTDIKNIKQGLSAGLHAFQCDRWACVWDHIRTQRHACKCFWVSHESKHPCLSSAVNPSFSHFLNPAGLVHQSQYLQGLCACRSLSNHGLCAFQSHLNGWGLHSCLSETCIGFVSVSPSEGSVVFASLCERGVAFVHVILIEEGVAFVSVSPNKGVWTFSVPVKGMSLLCLSRPLTEVWS